MGESKFNFLNLNNNYRIRCFKEIDGWDSIIAILQLLWEKNCVYEMIVLSGRTFRTAVLFRCLYIKPLHFPPKGGRVDADFSGSGRSIPIIPG